jgi:hypothetical protein
MGHPRRPNRRQGFADVRYAFNATESVRRNEPTRCAITGREQPQQIATLFDHLVGAGQQRGWNGETKRRGGLEVDD